MVPISQIELTPPWNKMRYEDNKKKIGETGKMPPAFLDFDDSTGTYKISDGIHRINAAKDLGYKCVPAVVSRKRKYPPATAELTPSEAETMLDVTKSYRLLRPHTFTGQRYGDARLFNETNIVLQIEGQREGNVTVRGKYPNDDYFATIPASDIMPVEKARG